MGVKKIAALIVGIGCVWPRPSLVEAHLSPPTPRTQLLWLHYDGTQFRLIRSQLDSDATSSYTPSPSSSGTFRLALESEDGRVLFVSHFDDPRLIHVDRVTEEGDIHGEALLLPETIVPLRVPYVEEATRLRISGGNIPTGVLPLEAPIEALDATGALPPYTTQTIIRTGPSCNRLDIVFLGDGYRATEMEKFDRDVRAFADHLLKTPPYAAYRYAINIHKVNVISRDSGIDRPSLGLYRDTALDMTFDFEGVPNAVYAPVESEYKIYRAAALVPDADLIIVLVNERDLGGSSGPLKNISVVTTHALGPELLVHELGHSLAFLADEDDGPLAPPLREPMKVNVTLERTREGLRRVGKWDYWIEDAQSPSESRTRVGLFEGGLGASYGVFRPAPTCKMRTLGQPFCPVCAEQHVRRFYFYIRPIDAVSPPPIAPLSVHETTADTLVFRVIPLEPSPGRLHIAWFVDGLPLEHHESSLSLPTATLSPGQHTVTVVVTDRTPFVRWDPSGLLSSRVSWTLTR